METPSVTIAFAPEEPGRTLADCLEQLLSHLNLEASGEERA